MLWLHYLLLQQQKDGLILCKRLDIFIINIGLLALTVLELEYNLRIMQDFIGVYFL